MGRSSDWWVLELESDPTPGSPDGAELLARRLHDFAVKDAQFSDATLTTAHGQVASAQSAMDAAKALAEQARRLREDAAHECTQKLADAADAGIHPRSFWDRAKESFSGVWHILCEDMAVSMANLAKSFGTAATTVVRDLGTEAGSTFNGLPHVTSKGNKHIPACGDPVDISTGRMFHAETDAELPGALPLRLTRTHRSDFRLGRFFGPSWASTLDQRIQAENGGVHFVTEDGSLLSYPEPDAAGPVFPVHGEAMPLRRTGDGGFVVTDRGSGRRLWFAPPDGEGAALLTAITGDDQHRIDVTRDGSGVPAEVRHSAGYAITVGSAGGLVTALTAGGEVLRAFRYGEHEQLTGIVNASGLAMTYDYDDAGRIARWDDRNGMWYRYEYDSAGRCVATEGRDGYFSYTFSYDPVRLVTRATDSLGHTTTFELNENLQVVATTDPLGGVVRTGWDDQHRLRSRVDQLGRATYWEHDGNGNVRSVTLPDGSSVLLDYDVHGEPIEIAGPDGGRWQF
ncbi:MAG: hypothetical protein QOJ50_2760, partial [Cryptosporangiaceae bacterium]|nr:hypothetical protein [Cryptosporangiaceae bacterium]